MTLIAKIPEADVTIARFKDDRAAAISFTFDDNVPDQATIAAPMLERYGFRGTFAVIAGQVPETGANAWPRWKQLAHDGHEIANHSLSHPDLTKLDDLALEREVNHARQIIGERIGTAPFSFIYPYNARDERVRAVVMEQHFAARERELFYGRRSFEAATANAWLDESILEKQWIAPMLHAIESGGYEPFANRKVLDDHLRYLQSRERDVWVGTFGHVAGYIRQRDAAALEIEHGEHHLSFRLRCDLNPEVFNLPLSVKVKLPTTRPTLKTVTQHGKPLEFKQRDTDILLQVVPSESPVFVSWS